jgi:CheY-like chemotaxis protein
MPLVLLCSDANLDAELASTVLAREVIDLCRARDLDEALQQAVDSRPNVVLIDREWAEAEPFVRRLRQDIQTRRLSVAILARDDFDPRDMELLEAGANSILRLPADSEWDDRLQRLIDVPVRRESRFPLYFEVEARSGIHSATATTVNLSVGGMLLESAFPLKMGDDIDLRFQIPRTSDTIVGTGQVVRLEGRGRFGVAFYGLEGDGAQRIREFIGESPHRDVPQQEN